jgi:hypothetical protein
MHLLEIEILLLEKLRSVHLTLIESREYKKALRIVSSIPSLLPLACSTEHLSLCPYGILTPA